MIIRNGNGIPVVSGNGFNIRGATENDFKINLSTISNPQVVSAASAVEVTSGNAALERTTSTLIDPNYIIDLSTSGTKQIPYTVESSDEDVAAYVDGNMIRVSDGDANILVSSELSKKSISLNFDRRTVGGASDRFIHYNDSLLASAENAIIAMVSNPSIDNRIFSSYNVRNTNFIGANITNLPVLMSSSSRGENVSSVVNMSQQRWLPISPLHVLTCGHYHAVNFVNQSYNRTAGQQISFVTNNNQVITRTIVSTVQNVNGGFYNSGPSEGEVKFNIATGELDPNGGGQLDVYLWLLDSPLPESIGFCKYFDPIAIGKDILKYGILHCCPDQFNRLYFGITNYPRGVPYYNGGITYTRKRESYFDNLGHAYINNDSGSPKMVLINNEMVYFDGVSAGCLANHAMRDQTNAFMTYLGGGYQLTMYS